MSGEHAGLNADFLWKTFVLESPDVGILALGVLADNGDIDVPRLFVPQRGLDAWV